MKGDPIINKTEGIALQKATNVKIFEDIPSPPEPTPNSKKLIAIILKLLFTAFERTYIIIKFLSFFF